MLLLRKLILALFMAAACCHVPACAKAVFENQSDIGRELKIPVHQWSDPDRPLKGIVVAIQALIFTGRSYDSLARHLAEKGYQVYAADMRGFGDWRSNTTQFDGDSAVHFTKSKDDLTNILKNLRRKYQNLPVYCLGESIGANFAIWEASTDPDLMDGAIASGLSYKVRLHPRPMWIVSIFLGLIHPKHPLNLRRYLQPILTDDKTVTLECLRDAETCQALSAVDLIKAAITNKNAVRLIDKVPESMPILIMAGEKDQVQKTGKIPEIVAKMGSKQTSLVVLRNKGHILLERRAIDPEAAQIVDSWLDNHAQPPAASTGGSGGQL